MMPRSMYVPQDIQELLEFVVSMQLSAPKFLDKTGYLSFLNLEYVFRQLNEGLSRNRQNLGEERYMQLIQMSEQMRALFEADPDDKTGDTCKGYTILHAMEDILRQVRRNA